MEENKYADIPKKRQYTLSNLLVISVMANNPEFMKEQLKLFINDNNIEKQFLDDVQIEINKCIQETGSIDRDIIKARLYEKFGIAFENKNENHENNNEQLTKNIEYENKLSALEHQEKHSNNISINPIIKEQKKDLSNKIEIEFYRLSSNNVKTFKYRGTQYVIEQIGNLFYSYNKTRERLSACKITIKTKNGIVNGEKFINIDFDLLNDFDYRRVLVKELLTPSNLNNENLYIGRIKKNDHNRKYEIKYLERDNEVVKDLKAEFDKIKKTQKIKNYPSGINKTKDIIIVSHSLIQKIKNMWRKITTMFLEKDKDTRKKYSGPKISKLNKKAKSWKNTLRVESEVNEKDENVKVNFKQVSKEDKLH